MTRRLPGRIELHLFCWVATLVILVTSSSADDFDRIRVRLVNGSSIRATIDSIDSNGVVSGSKNLGSATIDGITSIITGKEVTQNETSTAILNLRFGGRLFCDSLTVKDDYVSAELATGTKGFPLEIAEAFVWQLTPKVQELISSPSNRYDSIVVSSSKGEVVVQGLFEKIDQTHVTIDYEGKSRKIAIEKVHAVVMANLGNQKPGRGFARVSLVDGSSICGGIKEYSNGILKISISEQFDVNVSAANVAKVDIRSSSVVYLSDLEPTKFEQQSQFSVPRNWQRDKSLMGNPIQLKYASSGRVVDFEKGIGTRSYTSIVFENSDGFSHFRTVVGIDAETNGNGDCEMIIEGDGIRLWSKRVTGTSDPEPVVVPIKDINEVALIVLPGANFDLADHAVWADAKFTKSE